jgi:amino acid transporter
MATAEHGFRRTLGLFQAVAINMTQICGIGPFVTIPLMVAAMGGATALLGWVLGAVLAICDGLIWAELGAAMPGAGGSYLYLREAFQYSTGRLVPFLFVWTAMIFIPLIMSTGVIGLAQYLAYYSPALDSWQTRWAVMALVFIALYRGIASIGKLTTLMWVIMLVAVGGVTVAAFGQFDPARAFTIPDGALALDAKFFAGLGAGLVIAIYDYLGYNTVAYMGDELREPGRVMPRAIVYSIAGMMVIYLCMNVGVLGALPWQDIAKSSSVGAAVLERAWGQTAAQVFTALIVIAAFGSVFAGLLGGSRVPYNAAKDGLFLPAFGRLHSRGRFPHVALIVMCVITAIGSMFKLDDVISMLVAVMVLLQSLAQIAALTILRRRQPALRRPYRMIWYPLPSVIAAIGWAYVYWASGTTPMLLALAWLVVGTVAFLIWARVEKTWPFGPRVIREEYLAAQHAQEPRGLS